MVSALSGWKRHGKFSSEDEQTKLRAELRLAQVNSRAKHSSRNRGVKITLAPVNLARYDDSAKVNNTGEA